MDNQYLAEFFKCDGPRCLMRTSGSYPRHSLVKRYAWAVPTDLAIATIVSHGPIIEIGAGTGYWAKLIAEAGGDIVAFDAAPPETNRNEWGHRNSYFDVRHGSHEAIAAQREAEGIERTLMLCWPPYDTSMAAECLHAYAGNALVYIGEGEMGCTGGKDFWDLINEWWDEDRDIALPQWDGIHDRLYIYKRRAVPRTFTVEGDEDYSWKRWSEPESA